MSDYPHPIIAREGWTFLAIALVIAVALTIVRFWWLAVPAWLAVLFIAQFFRDPARAVPQGARLVLAPADGRIVKVEKARDPYLDRDALVISVFMNVFNVHSNRAPVEGEVRNAWYHQGRFFNAELDKASLENERNALHLRTSAGEDIVCVQIAGLIARRILCYVKRGDHLAAGQRYGFIRFGSRVDVYLTPTAVPKVSVGEVVHATSTVFAELPE